jgi:putative lipoic acid-binding regulatory protein
MIKPQPSSSAIIPHMEKNDITYPRSWSYRVIGLNKDDMTRDIKIIMASRKYALEDANKKGKYISLHLELIVSSEDERNGTFAALKGCDSVTMVL